MHSHYLLQLTSVCICRWGLFGKGANQVAPTSCAALKEECCRAESCLHIQYIQTICHNNKLPASNQLLHLVQASSPAQILPHPLTFPVSKDLLQCPWHSTGSSSLSAGCDFPDCRCNRGHQANLPNILWHLIQSQASPATWTLDIPWHLQQSISVHTSGMETK